MKKYRQISFVFIPISSHPISFDLRDKAIKYSGNNVVTSEKNLRVFIDMLNDFEVEHEDVVMKLFVQSLIKDVRD